MARLRTQSLWSSLTLNFVLRTLVGSLLFNAGRNQCDAMPHNHVRFLREQAQAMFHHGFDSYMEVAYPADEIRPLTCTPLTRDFENLANVGINDILGNYSLTAIDSLSALAMMSHTSKYSLTKFWETVQSVSELYWPYGFDSDAKVQVFETVIRGVGGLLSGHEFAAGILPMGGKPRTGVNGWKYNDELLFLAHDLATRLLPAFNTPTGIPYPRVNLRHGCVNLTPEQMKERLKASAKANSESRSGSGSSSVKSDPPVFEPLVYERSDTCSAGAGSLTLEFTVLSRLLREYLERHPDVERTANEDFGIYAKHMWRDVDVFERVSHKAFWSIWERRSELDLVGGGIDAYSGKWDQNGGYISSIGASTDSFFEYALKTYILLSSSPTEPSALNPNPSSAAAFLEAYHTSIEAINQHLMVEQPTIYYQAVNMDSGAPVGGWVDSLSAFWPGLLVLGGDIETAEKANLFYTALWQRFHALPERYSPLSYTTPLAYWPGRPEFIESVYHLYRATKDVWYLRVGEMVLQDIQARSWGRCGWSGMDDVRTGKRSDRQESFMLSETFAYLYLLYDDDNPLHKGDIPWVFTTEGHPLRMPVHRSNKVFIREVVPDVKTKTQAQNPLYNVCQNPHVNLTSHRLTPPFFSATASRSDIFHAFQFLRLDLLPEFLMSSQFKISGAGVGGVNMLPMGKLDLEHYSEFEDENMFQYTELYSPTNNSFYPWTLPRDVVAPGSNCSKLPGLDVFDLLFPASTSTDNKGVTLPPAIQKINKGLLVSALNGVRVSFYREVYSGAVHKGEVRIRKLGPYNLGKDDYVVIDKKILDGVSAGDGMEFKFKKEEGSVDIMFDFGVEKSKTGGLFRSSGSGGKRIIRRTLQAITPSGIGAQDSNHLIKEFEESKDKKDGFTSPVLPFKTIYNAGLTCKPLPNEAMYSEVILMKRGDCPFAKKLNNIPQSSTIKLAIVVSYDSENPAYPQYSAKYNEATGLNDWFAFPDPWLIRPLVDQYQVTKHGQKRKQPIPLLLVGGGDATYNAIAEAIAIGVRARWKAELGQSKINNLVAVE